MIKLVQQLVDRVIGIEGVRFVNRGSQAYFIVDGVEYQAVVGSGSVVDMETISPRFPWALWETKGDSVVFCGSHSEEELKRYRNGEPRFQGIIVREVVSPSRLIQLAKELENHDPKAVLRYQDIVKDRVRPIGEVLGVTRKW